jgi:eukaryotic-like serine/threonine-protein kinase
MRPEHWRQIEDLYPTRHRFQLEARMASSLNHPHIVTVHDAGDFAERQYLVTEFIDGVTLKEWALAETRNWEQIVELLTGAGCRVQHLYDGHP